MITNHSAFLFIFNSNDKSYRLLTESININYNATGSFSYYGNDILCQRTEEYSMRWLTVVQSPDQTPPN